MKIKTKWLILLVVLALQMSSLFIDSASAQTIPPPPPPGEKGGSGNRGPMGESPIGDGAWILVALVIGYGVHSITSRKKQNETKEE
ncbi:MAG: hypothetical protein IPH88_00425 [Bacteroidales bacterium]|nr:hypothetical protein [Bacteroidales bacterium]